MSYGTARGMANDLTWRSLLISGVHDCLPACSFTEPEGSWKIENCHLKKKKRTNGQRIINQLKLEVCYKDLEWAQEKFQMFV